jgi:hypothetical protein
MSAIRQIYHVFGLILTIALTFILLYVSRFWIWKGPWSGDGLFGAKVISPYGNLVQWWMNGTWLAEFNFVAWGCGAIALLSILHWLAARFSR